MGIAYLETIQDWKEQDLVCPTATKRSGRGRAQSPTFNIFNAGHLTNADHANLGPTGIAGSYGITGYCLIPSGGTSGTYEGGVSVKEGGWMTAGAKGAANVPWFIEALRFDLWPLHTDAPAENEFAAWSGNNTARCAINRHQGFLNVAFMDWSVRKVQQGGVDLQWHTTVQHARAQTKAAVG
jgi:prepilin-type processing-associated H-X9-DG protein